MVITRFVFEWFAGINCIILRSQITVLTAPLTRRGKTKFATIKWYNLCRQIIQSQTCYPLICVTDDNENCLVYVYNCLVFLVDIGMDYFSEQRYDKA